EKLSLVTPMVLRNSGRVGNCRFSRSPLIRKSQGALLRLVVRRTICVNRRCWVIRIGNITIIEAWDTFVIIVIPIIPIKKVNIY
ncbi:hypothetical protein, partial [Bacteroides sp.]|uniref:hypothetical protein n=1 Tax=Bacteroides sp. TaxID=29523 RepID=UPI0026239F11